MSLSHCSEVVVGGGWSGVYWAWRRLDQPGYDASGLCLLEASGRLGGRTYTVRDLALGGHNFTLDVGAYRFSPDMHLPGDVILKLALPTACYEPGCPSAKKDMPKPFQFNYSAPLRRIIDPATGLPAGYATALEAMAREIAAAGATVTLGAELVGIEPRGGAADGAAAGAPALRIKSAAGGATQTERIEPAVVMLNVPRARLLPLPGVASLLGGRVKSALSCIRFDSPKGAGWKNFSRFHSGNGTTALSKAYLGYESAWWRSPAVNLTEGEYPQNAFFPIATSKGVPIGVRWSDGPVRCAAGAAERGAAGGAERECAGFLEIFYSVSNETLFRSVSRAPVDPLGVATRATAGATLDLVHEALLEAISPLLTARGVKAASLPKPSLLAVGVWTRPDAKEPLGPPVGYTAPTKVYYAPEVSGSLGAACGVSGLSEGEYRLAALQPLGPGAPLYMANNDWVVSETRYMYGDWAEESLLQAERALRVAGQPRPAWLDADYYEQRVASVLGADRRAAVSS